MSLTGPELLRLSHQATVFRNAENWQDAAHCWEQILSAQPNWEHGYGWFDLAGCYEDSGRISDARLAYEKAVNVSPADSTLVGGLASFLYLHGQTAEAFDAHVRLLMLDRMRVDAVGEARTMTALTSLASRLGWTGDETIIRINQRLAEFTPLQ